MDTPKLSILIPSLVSRIETRQELIDGLKVQIGCKNEMFIKHPTYTVEIFSGDEAEIILIVDNKEMTTGAKRNLLLETASGEYISFIDDDDWVAPQYFSDFKKAVVSNPDCISFSGWITEDGMKRVDWELSKDFENRTVFRGGMKFYERTVNHLCFVKRNIALQAGFPDKSNAEDKFFSERLKHLVKTEIKIRELLYHYRYNSKVREY